MALLHNNDSQRLAHIRPALAGLQSTLADAVFRHDSAAGLREAIAGLGAGAAYVDLAGGFAGSQLSLAAVKGARYGRFLDYTRPVTNTLGACLLTRPLGQALVSLIDAHPEWRLFAADWMVNRCFIELVDRGVAVRCRHAVDPTIFIHGSHAGTYSSTLT